MKLSKAFSLLTDFRLAVSAGLFPTIKALYSNPTLLFKINALSKIFVANVWATFAEPTDEAGRDAKNALIPLHAYGVVLDIGAGRGHTARYLNRELVSRYVALEPNAYMHPYIRAEANKAEFYESDGTLIILSCGAEDTMAILSALSDNKETQLSSTLAPSPNTTVRGSDPPIDTVIFVLTMCTIPSPKKTISSLVRDILKPGGQLLMYEHVLSPLPDVAWWQRFWAPLWCVAFEGCRMDRASDLLVKELTLCDDNGRNEVSAWRELNTWGKEGEDPENLFWHSVGRFVKR